jgi:hypothetical protein
MSSTIHVCIYSLTNTNNDEKEPIEINFYATEKLNWNNLVQLIIKSTACIDLPIVLYYKINGIIESLENQEQLERLLTTKNIQGLRFYGEKEFVNQPVFVFLPPSQPPLPANSFLRLGQLTDRHKKVISKSRQLSRCVGILASAIAMDTNNKDFDKEFKALEKVIEVRKQDYEEAQQRDSEDEKTLVNDEKQRDKDEDSLDALYGDGAGHRRGGGRGRHHRGGFGIGFGGRGEFFGRGREGRGGHHRGDLFGGHHHHREEFESHVHRGIEGGHHHHTEEFGEGGHHRRGGRHHHHGGPADFFAAILASEEKLGGKKKHLKEAPQACFRGSGGCGGSFDDGGESSKADEMKGLQTQLSNTHIDSKQKSKGTKKNRRRHPNNQDHEESPTSKV